MFADITFESNEHIKSVISLLTRIFAAPVLNSWKIFLLNFFVGYI